jgi:hypothetical protein
MGSFLIGNGRTLTATFLNAAQQEYDPPAVYFVIETPPDALGAVVKTIIQYGAPPPSGWPPVSRVSTGVYQVVLPYANLNRVGNWRWGADDGNNVVASEADFEIEPRSATH